MHAPPEYSAPTCEEGAAEGGGVIRAVGAGVSRRSERALRPVNRYRPGEEVGRPAGGVEVPVSRALEGRRWWWWTATWLGAHLVQPAGASMTYSVVKNVVWRLRTWDVPCVMRRWWPQTRSGLGGAIQVFEGFRASADKALRQLRALLDRGYVSDDA